MAKKIFSGVQPTGNLHLGNYLGALKNFVNLQKEAECIYCVVDLHAITTFQDPNELKHNILETTAGFLATGLDPDKSTIFNQSSVSCHAELLQSPGMVLQFRGMTCLHAESFSSTRNDLHSRGNVYIHAE